MKWFAPSELATLKLPGLPTTKRGVNDLAAREAWESRARKGCGGGREYPISALPTVARTELEARAHREAAAQAIAVTAEKQQRQIEAVSTASLTARQRLVMEARAGLLLELDRLVNVEGVGRSKAVMYIVEGAKTGTLPAETARLAAVANDKQRGLSRASVYNWLAAREQSGRVSALAPQLTRRPDPLPSWFGDFFGYYARPQKPTIAMALANWQCARPGDTLPTYRQVCVALDKLGQVERLRGRLGAQELKTAQAYKVRDTSDLLPTSVYVADGKTYDAEIAHPIHGQPFRPELTTIVDAHTRKAVGFSVDLDENRFGVTDALRVACTLNGIPALFYTDRGPGYVNDTMTNSLTGFLARLSITPMRALPYNSQAKGIIERLNRMWSDDARQYDTYIGRDMDKEAKQAAFKKTRKEVALFGASRTLPTWQDFVANCAAALDRYNNAPHSSLPRMADPETGRQRHMSPNEAWALAARRGFEAIVVTEAEAADLFRPWVTRKVARCMVNWLGNSYFAPALEQYHGREVILAFDLQDASQVWLRDIDLVDGERQPGRLIAVAAFEGNKTRYVPVSYERAAMEKRAKGRERRLEKKLDTVRQELHPAKLLNHAPGQPVIDITPMPEAVPVLAPEPARIMSNGRPRFSSDVELIRWLLANPAAATISDRDYITSDVISTHTGKEQLRLSGIDLAAVRMLVKSAA